MNTSKPLLWVFAAIHFKSILWFDSVIKQCIQKMVAKNIQENKKHRFNILYMYILRQKHKLQMALNTTRCYA